MKTLPGSEATRGQRSRHNFSVRLLRLPQILPAADAPPVSNPVTGTSRARTSAVSKPVRTREQPATSPTHDARPDRRANMVGQSTMLRRPRHCDPEDLRLRRHRGRHEPSVMAGSFPQQPFRAAGGSIRMPARGPVDARAWRQRACAANRGSSHGASHWTPAGVKCVPSLRTWIPASVQVNLPFGQTFLPRSSTET